MKPVLQRRKTLDMVSVPSIGRKKRKNKKAGNAIATTDQIREIQEKYMRIGTKQVTLSSEVPARTWSSHALECTSGREFVFWCGRRRNAASEDIYIGKEFQL